MRPDVGIIIGLIIVYTLIILIGVLIADLVNKIGKRNIIPKFND